MNSVAANTAASTDPGPAPRSLLRVLVVEDNPDDYAVLIDFLARSAGRVEAERVEDGPGLRAALGHRLWDLVISDHRLPRFDSAAALRMVRELQPDLPLIIVSGLIGETVAVDAMLGGADDYVMKHSLARLRPAIERCLAARAVSRQKREAEARLAAIAHHLPGAVFQMSYRLTDGEVRFTYLSHGAEALLDASVASLLESASAFFARTAQRAGESLLERIKACARAGGFLEWEGRLDDDNRWLAVRASPRRLEPDSVVWDGSMMDISVLMRAKEELRESRERLRDLTAAWELRVQQERSAFARELHDDVGGTLAALKAEADWLRRRAGPELQPKIESIDRLAGDVINASVRLAQALRHGELGFGVVAAIEAKAAEFAARMGIPCTFVSNETELDLTVIEGHALYRVFQEALTNITKHAAASRVDVELFCTAAEVTLEVRDNGSGLAPGALVKRDSFGVRGMHERIERFGGWVEVSGEPGKGTTVMVSLPRWAAEADP